MNETAAGERARADRNGAAPADLASLSVEERRQMRQEMLKQSAAKLENARVNFVMAKAAHAALLADPGE